MKGEPDIAAAAALLADPTRATLLMELVDGLALPPSELAERARVSRATASEHLAKLRDAGLVAVERGGRNRYYRIADPAVAGAIEAVAAIARPRPVRSLREATRNEAIRAARTCYGHLAGATGVALADALLERGLVVRQDDSIEVTDEGRERLRTALGLELPRAGTRASEGKPCNDWSERRPHVAGPLGVAITRRLFEVGWIERIGSGRAARVTPEGRRGLSEAFGAELP
jgi:DNA-binding transcriptional ArsR family regulator